MMSTYNEVRYAAYRTALKLRFLQVQIGLDKVSLENLQNAFDYHGLTSCFLNDDDYYNSNELPKRKSVPFDYEKDIPFELRLINVAEIISCLKMIFESAQLEQQKQQQQLSPTQTQRAKKQTLDTNNGNKKNKNSEENKTADMGKLDTINVAQSVDLCLNLLLDLYDS